MSSKKDAPYVAIKKPVSLLFGTQPNVDTEKSEQPAFSIAIARLGDELTRKQLLEDAIAYNLSLNEIKSKIKEIKPLSKSEAPSIKDQVDELLRPLNNPRCGTTQRKK